MRHLVIFPWGTAPMMCNPDMIRSSPRSGERIEQNVYRYPIVILG
jgi:hypothetical protein